VAPRGLQIGHVFAARLQQKKKSVTRDSVITFLLSAGGFVADVAAGVARHKLARAVYPIYICISSVNV
jgi:hypothetical protein